MNIIEKLNKNNCYCNGCLKDGIVTKLIFNQKDKIYNAAKCKHDGSHFWRLEFRDDKWVNIQGRNPSSKIMKQDFTNRLFHHNCEKCNFKESNSAPNSAWKCPICNFFKPHNVKHICSKCSFEQINTTPHNMWVCSKCDTSFKNFHHKCGNCDFKESNSMPKPNWICSKCGWKLVTEYNYICSECGFKGKTNNPHWRCKKCGYSYESNGGFKLNREDFYKNKIGVWSRWNEDGICLDVCKTIDIGKEMLSSIRSFDSLIENPNQILDYGWKKKYKKQLNDCNGGKIIFKIVSLCATDKEALKIEAQYAHNNKSKYWSPQPGQMSIIETYNKL